MRVEGGPGFVLYGALGFALCQLSVAAHAGVVPLADLFEACEDAIYDGPDQLFAAYGPSLRQDEFVVALETEHGWVVLDYAPPASDDFEFCGLWGSVVPELEGQNLAFASWPSVRQESAVWFELAMEVPGSVALGGEGVQGHFIARCDDLEHGVALSSQQLVRPPVAQLAPEVEVVREEAEVFYQFSVQTVLPGRCDEAVARFGSEGGY